MPIFVYIFPKKNKIKNTFNKNCGSQLNKAARMKTLSIDEKFNISNKFQTQNTK